MRVSEVWPELLLIPGLKSIRSVYLNGVAYDVAPDGDTLLLRRDTTTKGNLPSMAVGSETA